MSELIDSIFDVAKIEKEIKSITTELDGFKSTIGTFSEDVKKALDATRAAKSGGDLAKQAKEINDITAKSKQTLTEYGAAQKELEAQENKLIIARGKALVATTNENKELIKLNLTSRDQAELLKLEIILNDKNAGSIEKAEAFNKKLQLEKRKLNLATKEGVEKLKEINIQQDKNNELLESGSNKLQKQKIGIGNYRDGFSTLTNQFKNGEIGLGGLAKGFLQVGKATLAALWPVGLIAAALGLLYTVFKNFAPLIDKIEQGFAGLTAAWGVLKNSLGQFLSGNKSLKESMSGVGDAMKEAARDAIELKKAEQNLADAAGGLEVANKKLETQMQQLLLQSKNKTLSEKESMDLIDQAMALEKQAFENKKKQNDEELRISLESIRIKNKLTADQYAKLKELGLDYAEELKDQGVQISDADVDRLKAALLANEDIEQQSISLVEKSMNRRDALQEKAAAAAEKAREKAAADAEKKAKEEEEREKKLLELKRKLKDTEIALMAEGEEKQIEISKENLKRQLEDLTANGQLTSELQANLEAINAKDLQKIRDDFAKQKSEKDKADFEKRIADFEKNIQKEVDLLSVGFREQETELKRQYASGKISKEKYEEELLKVQSDALKEANEATIKALQKELEFSELSVDKRAEISTKLKDLQIANENAALDATIKANDEKLNSDKDTFDKRVEIAEQLSSAGMELFGAIADFQAQQSEKRLAEIEKEQAANDKYFENRQKNLDNSIMSDESRAMAQKKIDEDRAKREEAIEKKKRDEQIKTAKWEKAQAVVSTITETAFATIKAWGMGPILGPIFAALAAATGAVSLATILGQQIPAYEKGGITGDGLALWGEAQPEVAMTPGGDVMFAEYPTVSKFDAGTRIFKSVEDFEKNMLQKDRGFEFDYGKMAQMLPKHSIELNGNGSWTMIDKENSRRSVINRKTKLN